ncbi:hypothetical protein ACFFMN_23490 [Planobispora siamensis]|uniref:Uncharacterized protein n=1 Tax=Planobispora siamensis TaxID=936338 RepID=A0A8J3WLI4_9ACTN|nr:hypothetical protein [Planobispora siamensis]GIH95329.1 hypothetical protein Psi01_59590 [Planobispora siamensis]
MNRDHGTYACYQLDGCRCYPCAAAKSAYAINRERAIAYGTWAPFVGAEPVRQHIAALREFGIGLRIIAQAAGIQRKTLNVIVNGRADRGTPPPARIRPRTATAILAVEPTFDLLGAKTIIDAAGTVRRLQALVTCGWSQAKLAERIGWTPSNIGTLMKAERVTVATARLVRGLYADLWDVAPPEGNPRDRGAASRARTYAAALNWLRPAAWDDDMIDLPPAALKEEIARQVALMDDEELRRCCTARYDRQETSPVIVAAAREYRRRFRGDRPRKAVA